VVALAELQETDIEQLLLPVEIKQLGDEIVIVAVGGIILGAEQMSSSIVPFKPSGPSHTQSKLASPTMTVGDVPIVQRLLGDVTGVGYGAVEVSIPSADPQVVGT